VSVGLSLPVLISRGGGARVLSVQLNHAEPESLKVSADNLKLSAIMARGTSGPLSSRSSGAQASDSRLGPVVF
jgi:hypothetical protein